MTSDKVEHDKRILFELLSGLGQVGVACAGVAFWSLFARVDARWFWAGAALWTVAVALKLLCARMVGKAAIAFLYRRLPYPGFVAAGGLYTGVQSSVFEMGLTLLAAFIWPSLGRGSGRAIAVGVGAGAIEAMLLAVPGFISLIYRFVQKGWAPMPHGSNLIEAETAPLYWLLGTVERTIALLCHASTRALLLLGALHGDYSLIFSGVALFTSIDGAAGAFHVSGKIRAASLWWIELALSPFALLSIFILLWCYEKFGL